MPKHISVLIPNYPGRLQDIAEVLNQPNPPVNIWAYHIANAGRTGMIQMVCLPHDLAMRALTGKYGHYVVESEILAIKVPNEPGQLFRLLRLLDGRDLVSSYQTLDVDGCAVIIIEMGSKGDVESARSILIESGCLLVERFGGDDGSRD
jgi:hypothetical protein